MPARTTLRNSRGRDEALTDREETYALDRWYEDRVGVGAGDDVGAASATYWVLPAWSELRTSTALAKACCCAADSRPASRKCRTVK